MICPAIIDVSGRLGDYRRYDQRARKRCAGNAPHHAQRSFILPIAIYETVLGLARIGNMSPTKAQNILDSFLEEVGVEISSERDAIQRHSTWAIVSLMAAPGRYACRYCSKATILR